MDKELDHLSNAMREVAAQRDKLLRESSGAISTDRLQCLHATLASQFPVEAALSEVAIRRDEALGTQAPLLPAHVAVALAQRLSLRRTTLESGKALWLSPSWLYSLLHSVGTPARVMVAVTMVILTAGALKLARWGHISGLRISDASSQRPAQPNSAADPAHQGAAARSEDSFLPGSGSNLTLRVSTIELASLRPSLLTMNRAFLPDRYESDRGLPLDLPIRQIFIEAERARMP